MVKPIHIKPYDTLEECFCEFLEINSVDEIGDKDYWSGYNGSKPFRINIKKWLTSTNYKCWGWVEYKTKTVHLWIDNDCGMDELVSTIAHEVAHLNKPRFKDKKEEEKKANKYAEVANMAYNFAKTYIELREVT